MTKRDKLEPLPDGFVAFHTEKGERWKHMDVEESGDPPLHYRLFSSEKGEQRRYDFGPRDARDATIWDLRDQLSRAKPAPAAAGGR